MTLRLRELWWCAPFWLLLVPAPQAAAQTFGQLLESDIPLEPLAGLPEGVRDRSRPELEPRRLDLAGMAVGLDLDAALGSSSNVLGGEAVRRGDGFTELRPLVTATADLGPDRAIGLLADYDRKRFFATPAKAEDGHRAELTAHAGFGDGGMLQLSAYQQRRYEDQLAASFPLGGGGSVAIDQAHAALRLVQGFDRVTLTGALGADRLEYHDTVTASGARLPQGQRDDSILRADLRGEYRLQENTAVFVQVSRRQTDFDHIPAASAASEDRSHDDWRLLGGVSANVTGLIRLSAAIGEDARSYRNPAFGHLATLAWDARADWFASPITTLALQAKREPVDDDTPGSPAFLASSFRLQLDHEFLRYLLFSASAGQERDRFEGIDRRDRLEDYALWADYWASAQLVLRPRLEWLNRSSSGAAAGLHIPEFRTELTISLRE